MFKEIISDGVIELRLIKVHKMFLGVPIEYQYEIFECSSSNMVGKCDYRVLHNQENYYGGNIGYMVFMPYRGNKYALRASRLLCSMAKSVFNRSIYITCCPDNTPSYKTIVALGATLIETVEVPKSHYLYRQGEFTKCIFKLELSSF